ncbi:hypothetical protein [Vibrio penaeicida]|uniref:hypothetical protein n=1 Tax=Vibrio penaeicida TaxID=104609 RepID=UPI000CEA693F|nr:hypothetical protein [Vibrio penaeicida]
MSDTPEKTAIESMNDIFILRANGKIAHLEYEDYANESVIIESITRNADKRKYFFTDDKNGSFPLNLAGPNVTKVIDWNLENQPSSHPQKKPGYFIDLRRITLNRLDLLNLKPDSKLKRDKPLTSDARDGLQEVPENRLYQLGQNPDEDNLYIAFYKHPAKVRSPNNAYGYCISYIPASVLDEYEISDNKIASLEDTKSLLEFYYGQTCVQSGAMNPDDFESSQYLRGGSAAACYVANLRTFKS